MDKEKAIIEAAAEIRRCSAEGTLVSEAALLEFLGGEENEDVLSRLKEENEWIELGVLLDKEKNEWYYSRTEMLPAYAATLLRVKDEDLLALIADTVRNESKTYPRATRVELFEGPPYRLTKEVLETVLQEMEGMREMEDIQRTRASNGTEFLFSTRHLTPFYAGKLAEWEEVESREIP